MCYIVFISDSLHWRYTKIALRKYVIICSIRFFCTINFTEFKTMINKLVFKSCMLQFSSRKPALRPFSTRRNFPRGMTFSFVFWRPLSTNWSLNKRKCHSARKIPPSGKWPLSKALYVKVRNWTGNLVTKFYRERGLVKGVHWCGNCCPNFQKETIQH